MSKPDVIHMSDRLHVQGLSDGAITVTTVVNGPGWAQAVKVWVDRDEAERMHSALGFWLHDSG